MLGLLTAAFHLFGLTWAHGPDCRTLWNRFKGLLSASIFFWALRPWLYLPPAGLAHHLFRSISVDSVFRIRRGFAFSRLAGVILPFARFVLAPGLLAATLLLLGQVWPLGPDYDGFRILRGGDLSVRILSRCRFLVSHRHIAPFGTHVGSRAQLA